MTAHVYLTAEEPVATLGAVISVPGVLLQRPSDGPPGSPEGADAFGARRGAKGGG